MKCKTVRVHDKMQRDYAYELVVAPGRGSAYVTCRITTPSEIIGAAILVWAAFFAIQSRATLTLSYAPALSWGPQNAPAGSPAAHLRGHCCRAKPPDRLSLNQ
jgi:hypothetical protein